MFRPKVSDFTENTLIKQLLKFISYKMESLLKVMDAADEICGFDLRKYQITFEFLTVWGIAVQSLILDVPVFYKALILK